MEKWSPFLFNFMSYLWKAKTGISESLFKIIQEEIQSGPGKAWGSLVGCSAVVMATFYRPGLWAFVSSSCDDW